MATWINDYGSKKEFDDKLIFFNNETILNKGLLHEHFNKKHRTKFHKHDIEFLCKKGQHSSVNQDNMFCIVDGDVKIYGIFDGHGENGHFISNFAMSMMINYVKNSNLLKGKSFLYTGDILGTTDEEVSKMIRCAFKYTQDKLRGWYEEFLKDQKRKKRVAEREQRRKERQAAAFAEKEKRRMEKLNQRAVN